MPIIEFEAELGYFLQARPSLLIRVSAGETGPWRDIWAALDTGSSHCAFSRELASSFGVEVVDPAPERMLSPGGPVAGWFESVCIEIPDIDTILTPLVFIVDGPRNPALLGLTGVLDHLILGLRHRESRLLLARDWVGM